MSVIDNRTTKKLRKLLEECGLSYQTRCLRTSWCVGSNLYAAVDNLDGTLIVGYLTPEQVMAATLGSDAVTEGSIDKWLRKFQREHKELVYISVDELRDLAYALHDDIPLGYEASMRLADWILHATLDSETCKQVLVDCNDGLMPPFTAHCGVCGAEWGFTPNYCPNCGRKVVR